MGGQHNEKRALERAAAEWFLQRYNELVHKVFRITILQERPDVVVEAADGTVIGIEVTHLYYDDLEAKMLLGRSVEEFHRPENFTELLDQLDRLLKKKLEVGRKYPWDHPLFLIIRSVSPVFTGEDFAGIEKYVALPTGIYDEIWLLVRDEVNDEDWSDLIRLL